MKNKHKTTGSAGHRRRPITTLRQPQKAHRFTPPPHHDLLVLGFYPGMGGNRAVILQRGHAGHSTAA